MPKLVTYRCPDCSKQFDFLHHPVSEPPPSHCPLCSSDMSGEPEKDNVFVLKIGTAKGKVADQLYRKMESATEARIEQAAEMSGADKSEFSNMKMTDMKDNLRAGDTTHMTAAATHSRAQLSYNVGGVTVGPQMQGAGQGAAFRDEVKGTPGAGSTRSALAQADHSKFISGSTRNGNMGKF